MRVMYEMVVLVYEVGWKRGSHSFLILSLKVCQCVDVFLNHRFLSSMSDSFTPL